MNTERKKVGMFVPPPIIFGVAGTFCLIGHYFWVGQFSFAGISSLLGAMVLFVSLSIIVASERQFKKSSTPVRPTSPTTKIVSSGIYQYSRNPMYIGMAGLLLGVGLLFNSLCFFITIIPVLTTLHFGVILPEERYLEALHEKAYAEYKGRVRRWL